MDERSHAICRVIGFERAAVIFGARHWEPVDARQPLRRGATALLIAGHLDALQPENGIPFCAAQYGVGTDGDSVHLLSVYGSRAGRTYHDPANRKFIPRASVDTGEKGEICG